MGGRNQELTPHEQTEQLLMIRVYVLAGSLTLLFAMWQSTIEVTLTGAILGIFTAFFYGEAIYRALRIRRGTW